MKRAALPLLVMLSACAASEHTPAPVYNAMIEDRDTAAGAHMVSPDESLSVIAKNYNLTIDDILRANNLGSADQVGAGQRLYLPSDNLSAASTATPPSNESQQQYIASAAPDEVLPSNPAISPVVSEPLAPITQTPLTDIAATVPPSPVASPVAPRAVSSLSAEQWQSPLSTGLRRPVRGPTLSSFGQKAGGLRNDGINIGARAGTPVESAADGEVVYNGNAVDGFGNLVLVKHKDGFVTAYGHLSRVDVTKGQTIRAGDIIGGVGQSGSVDAPQLHFQVRKAGAIVDPAPYLSATQITGL